MSRTLRCKVAVLGDSGVGKSALCSMFRSDGAQYPKNYVMTVGAEFSTKSVVFKEDNAIVEMYLIDLSGKEMYKDFWPKILDGCSTFAVVYDTSSEASFNAVEGWIEVFRTYCPGNSAGVLIGNKSDLEERTEVRSARGLELAQSNGLEFFEASALKGGEPLEAPFHYLARTFLTMYEDKIQHYCQLESTAMRG